eukprot:gene160-biopygen11147
MGKRVSVGGLGAVAGDLIAPAVGAVQVEEVGVARRRGVDTVRHAGRDLGLDVVVEHARSSVAADVLVGQPVEALVLVVGARDALRVQPHRVRLPLRDRPLDTRSEGISSYPVPQGRFAMQKRDYSEEGIHSKSPNTTDHGPCEARGVLAQRSSSVSSEKNLPV